MSKTRCILLGLALLGILVGIGECGEETCKQEDGKKVCSEELDANEDEEGHNVWTDLGTEHFDNDKTGDEVTNQDFNVLELIMVSQFYNLLGDWNKTSSSLANYQPATIIFAILNSVNTFDINGDGFLEYDEVEWVLSELELCDDFSRVQEIFSTYKEQRISIFQCLDFFKKMRHSEITTPLLSVIDVIQDEPAKDANKILMLSIQMFLDADKDGDGRLDKVEFAISLNPSLKKQSGLEADLYPEQLTEAIKATEDLFDFMDKDKDEYVGYTEYLAANTPKFKDEHLNKIFQEIDLNSDGFLSQKEFEKYIKARSKKWKVAGPSDRNVRYLFHKFDTNDDEMLSVEEMNGVFKYFEKSREEERTLDGFSKFDTDSDGVLSKDEGKKLVKLAGALVKRKLDTDEFMSLLDENKDGVVSMDELRDFENVVGKLRNKS